MARETTINRLKREQGANWLVHLRDTINSATGQRHGTANAASAIGVDAATMKKVLTEVGITKQHVHLLKGDVLVIRRGGVETVVSDRTQE